jgi:hypothetical protein
MNKILDYIDTDDCRNKIEHLHLVYDFKHKELAYYHSYEKYTMQKKKKVVIKPAVYICINSKTREVFEMTKEEYDKIKE